MKQETATLKVALVHFFHRLNGGKLETCWRQAIIKEEKKKRVVSWAGSAGYSDMACKNAAVAADEFAEFDAAYSTAVDRSRNRWTV